MGLDQACSPPKFKSLSIRWWQRVKTCCSMNVKPSPNFEKINFRILPKDDPVPPSGPTIQLSRATPLLLSYRNEKYLP